jgi:NAD(P)-dependent dehydrogenase (short-subunit alcohol dehydrogenase family)
MSNRLEGKTALVTGAASGIGQAVAARFVNEGAVVYFADVNEAGIADAVAAARSLNALPLHLDISDEQSVAAGYRTIAQRHPLDVVVANAGVQLFGQDAVVGELALEVWEKTMSINLRGAFLTLKYAVRALDGRGGSIVVTGSPTAVVGVGRGFSAYSSSKAGIHGLARVVAADYAHAGIRVNTVVPGYTETPLVQAIAQNPADRAVLVDATPLGRAGTAADLEGIMVYLASDESSYATGGLFSVDGGMTAI